MKKKIIVLFLGLLSFMNTLSFGQDTRVTVANIPMVQLNNGRGVSKDVTTGLTDYES